MHIKAPFNFVPLSEQVVRPWWGPHISHDIPFADQQSGVIQVELEAFQPLFVGDGKVDANGVSLFARLNDDTFLIPGSSLRGMIRSVLEIMTFSKMDKIADKRFAYRDWENNHLYKKSDFTNEAKGGWLSYNKNEDKYTIHDCGTPKRVHHDCIGKCYPQPNPQNNFDVFFSVNGDFDPKKDAQKTAEFKYKHLNATSLVVQTEEHPDKDDPRKHKILKVLTKAEIKANELDPSPDVGTLVLTGQSSPRDPRRPQRPGKSWEFVFTKKYGENAEMVVDPEVVEDFKVAYEYTNESSDWKFWQEKLKKGEEIPVFYHSSGGKDNKVESFGLSQLYKKAYKQSILDLLPKDHKEDAGPDMAEAIFGYTSDNGGNVFLKGRVHISHAHSIAGTAQEGAVIHEILSSPKPTYYPSYISQETNNDGTLKGQTPYQTYNSTDAKLNGWKRYPIRKEPYRNHNTNHGNGAESENADVVSHFKPLAKGARFSFVISYHNLRKVELGALLSALSFHKHEECFHSIGMGKPLGLGKVKLSLPGFPKSKLEECMRTFEAFMCKSLGESWYQSPQIEELFAMAREQGDMDRRLAYMTLDPNEFTAYKNDSRGNTDPSNRESPKALRRYTAHDEVVHTAVKTLLGSEEDSIIFQKLTADKELFDRIAKSNSSDKDPLKRQEMITNSLLEKLKLDVMKELEAKKEAIEKTKEAEENKTYKAKQEAKIAARKAKALKNGPDINYHKQGIGGWRDLEQSMIKFQKELKLENHSSDDPSKGWIPFEEMEDQEFKDKLVGYIKLLCQTQNKKVKKKWKSQPHIKAKVAKWIGKDSADKLWEELGDEW